ncbi:hypothetical protein NSK11_contig00044-0046 [Nocardia seriolae]|uniref:Uncharacterized protein n=1 Tax=Nocardia seriolae TaxID=37332 RepID=A0ABC9YU55_9NOCA|nr:hypothetical protein NSERKGN1266_76120 [Nocardia seriolae]BEK99514.1 hypothetical protein NSER024013_74200 [Nocardia seriolae]GAM46951.1 hypothetical protein NS07_v2contig00040-0046 [Nocardia seriolae]GAP28855.1 hypothetical protein NSK11_contig00044-0046 [Nocardia seriolae]GEM24424.1 hypothetical protein NS2_26630 [Nocardia seriolae NBRC 15557]
MLAGSGEHDGANLGVGVEFAEDERQLTPEVRAHGIALAGTGERHLGDVVLAFDLESLPFGHRSSVSGVPAVRQTGVNPVLNLLRTSAFRAVPGPRLARPHILRFPFVRSRC